MTQPPPDPVLLDASCLLNLYATGRLQEIAESLPQPLAVVDYVISEEALFIWSAQEEQSERQKVPLNLDPLIVDRLLQILSLSGREEEASFVDFAALLDDGEAMTFAIAVQRGFPVATDDRKARRVLAEQVPTAILWSTLELVKHWAESEKVPVEELREALANVQARASYLPGERDPLYGWWKGIMYSGE